MIFKKVNSPLTENGQALFSAIDQCASVGQVGRLRAGESVLASPHLEMTHRKMFAPQMSIWVTLNDRRQRNLWRGRQGQRSVGRRDSFTTQWGRDHQDHTEDKGAQICKLKSHWASLEAQPTVGLRPSHLTLGSHSFPMYQRKKLGSFFSLCQLAGLSSILSFRRKFWTEVFF